MQRQIELIGAAWGLGGAEPGCAEAPAALMPLVADEMERCGVAVRSGPILSPLRTERRISAVLRGPSKATGLVAERRSAF